jgi:hypothetical protein
VLANIVGVEPSALSTSIATDVVVTFSEPIATVPSGGISLTGAGTLDTARFSFPYLGDNTKARVGITSTSVTGITFAGIIDVNEGAATSPSASITTISGPSGLQYGSAANFAYAADLISDTGSWTWQMWVNIPQPAGYAVGAHFAGLEWHEWVSGDFYPMESYSDLSTVMTVGVVGGGGRRLTITRSGNVFEIFLNGVSKGSRTKPAYAFNNQFRANKGYFNTTSIYPDAARIWDHTIWNSVRTAAQIAANDLTGALHHYSLNGTLADSVGSINLTAAGTPTYIAR